MNASHRSGSPGGAVLGSLAAERKLHRQSCSRATEIAALFGRRCWPGTAPPARSPHLAFAISTTAQPQELWTPVPCCRVGTDETGRRGAIFAKPPPTTPVPPFGIEHDAAESSGRFELRIPANLASRRTKGSDPRLSQANQTAGNAASHAAHTARVGTSVATAGTGGLSHAAVHRGQL